MPVQHLFIVAHGPLEPFVGHGAGAAAAPAQGGLGLTLTDDAGVVSPLVLALDEGQRLSGTIEGLGALGRELSRPGKKE